MLLKEQEKGKSYVIYLLHARCWAGNFVQFIFKDFLAEENLLNIERIFFLNWQK